MWVKTTKWVTVDDLCLELWSGARDRWINATDEQREEAFARLEAYFDQACADDGEENAVEMVTVNDALWFDMDDIWDGEEEDETDDDMSKLYIDRYGIHAGRITCDGCHSVFAGNPFVDDDCSEYCSKECAEANGATGVHEDIAECAWCHYHSYGYWWTDNDGNCFCSKMCAIRYNLNAEETAKQEENDNA